MDEYDHYEEARIIADHLEKAGHPDQSASLRAAMTDSASGTEIFMRLRHTLIQIRSSCDNDPSVQSRIDVLIERINSSLQ